MKLSNYKKLVVENGFSIMQKRMIFLVMFYSISFISCKKLVETNPPITSLNEENVYQDDQSAISAINGLYIGMVNSATISEITGTTGISLYAGLSSDEYTLYGGGNNSTLNSYAYYENKLFSNSTETSGVNGGVQWNRYFALIYRTNSVIQGVSKSVTLTPFIKQQLLGESKFLRAFYYFYLVNLFGDVPLILTTDWKINSIIVRSSTAKVYGQIVDDLKDAQNLLSADYLDGALIKYTGIADRLRPTRAAATALLARTYLYQKDYTNAELQATNIITNSLFSLPALNAVFLKNSAEAIWQLQPVIAGWNTEDAKVFILTGAPNDAKPISLSTFLMNAFEATDQRKVIGNWINRITVSGINYYYPYKYKIATQNAGLTEYFMVFRLAEQYLIRAEARAQQDNISGAQSDLNTVRFRAGLPTTIAIDKPSLLTAVEHERQVEFFSEWGHRWFDLKRTGRVDDVMSIITPLKANGAIWKSYQQLYPIPYYELDKNPNMVQNTGY